MVVLRMMVTSCRSRSSRTILTMLIPVVRSFRVCGCRKLGLIDVFGVGWVRRCLGRGRGSS